MEKTRTEQEYSKIKITTDRLCCSSALKNNRVIIILILVLFTGCKKENLSSNIEIYLLKSRKIERGTELSKMDFYDKYCESLQFLLPHTRVDSVNKEFIYAGKFSANSVDLNNKPILTNSEILFLDTIGSKLIITKSGLKKIINLKRELVNGCQFAITENDQVIFTGYFWDFSSSYLSHWNSLYFDSQQNYNEENIELDLYRNHGMKNPKFDSINFKDYPKLIRAFSSKNKKYRKYPLQ